ncbi:ribonuclease D [Fluctibacter halophilus]
MQYTFIRSNAALADYCQKASHKDAIAVDTEFVRTRTLYPQLGLIQLYDGEQLVLVDPLDIDDFEPLVALLVDPTVVKVLHSCSEDLETFWHALGVTPAPIFDTQFAACLAGMGATLGYANLVEAMLGIQVDKGESRTDWLARPLSEQQCDYAAYDVWYLYQLYPELKARVTAAGKLDWVFAEMAHLCDKKRTAMPPELAYLGIKNNWQLRGRNLFALQHLAKWRLNVARQRDMALNFVIREHNLVEIARRLPTNKGGLAAISGITPQEIRKHGDTLLALVDECRNTPPEQFPPPVERLVEYPGYKRIAGDIRQVCLRVAEQHQVPVEVMGSKKQIGQLLKWCWFDQDETRMMGLTPDLLNSWRKPLLEDGLNDILGNVLRGKH